MKSLRALLAATLLAFCTATLVADDGNLGTRAGESKTVKIAGVDVVFCWCPPGEFVMGSPTTESGRGQDEDQRRVRIAQGFWLAETETTQRLWQAVMNRNPSDFRSSDEELPVDNVSWNDCQRFIDAVQKYAPAGLSFKLPTEEHWEYACRAGTTTAYWWDSDDARSGKGKLNGFDETCAKTYRCDWESFPFDDECETLCAVGRFEANRWGLKDMAGNLSEWCADRYRPATSDAPEARVHRGGCWYDPPTACRSAARNGFDVTGQGDFLGLRLELSAGTALKAGDEKTVLIAGIPTKFRWCPPGEFMMGSPESVEGRYKNETQHYVTLTRGFWLGEVPVTVAAFRAFAVATDYKTSAERDELPHNWQTVKYDDSVTDSQRDAHPVVCINWGDVKEYLSWLNQNYAPSGAEFKLPTEAQWEYACRAGTTSIYWWGDAQEDAEGKLNGADARLKTVISDLEKSFPFDDGYAFTSPVGNYLANPWGLKDMKGNVDEWCADWYADDLGTERVTDPVGPSRGQDRVVRGGTWKSEPNCFQSAHRHKHSPSESSTSLGLRLVLTATPEELSGSNQSSSQKLPPPPPSSRQAGDVFTVEIAGVKTNFRWCPPGEFMMGSPKNEEGRDEEETRHKVRISRGFWLAEVETTQELWETVTGSNPSNFKGNNLPVESVNWDDCQSFVEKIQQYAPSGMRFQLPSEAHWEYACRAGTTTPFSFGTALNGDKANCDGNYPYGTKKKGKYLKKTTPVGSYVANAWGLYDMHGNVWEWCSDWYGDYPRGEATDPTGSENGSIRVFRGGGWNDTSRCCRSAGRGRNTPESRGDVLGFRLELVTISDEFTASEPLNIQRSATPPSSTPSRPADDVLTVKIAGVKTNFRWCPPGEFMMGSPESEEGRDEDETRHNVKISRGFWLAEVETTQELWQKVTGSNPSYFKGNKLPVEFVSWNDCQSFIEKIQQYAPNGMRFQLPSEAHWEYACRAGTTGRYNVPGASLDSLAWYSENSNIRTHPVGGKSPNSWGLYDMHGNVWEWCSDWYGDYPGGEATYLTGSKNGSGRVSRGGGWSSASRNCRSAIRRRYTPELRDGSLGFRLELTDASK